MRAPVALLAIFGPALVGACRPDPAPAPRSTGHVYIDSEGGGELTVDGARIKIDGSLRFRYRSPVEGPDGPRIVKNVDGHPFGIRDHVFFVGDEEYGEVAEGNVVLVSRDGVTIDGEHRGDLPPAKSDG